MALTDDKEIAKTCEFCGELFTPRRENQKYCNKYCREGRRFVVYDRPCEWCGKPVNSTNPKAKFCTSSCRTESFKAAPCIYCGQSADTTDQVGSMEVRCCYECRLILGHSTLSSLERRRTHIRSVIIPKYKKILDAPDWSAEEIADLGYGLRSHIQPFQEEKNKLKRRIMVLSSDSPMRDEVDDIVDQMMIELGYA